MRAGLHNGRRDVHNGKRALPRKIYTYDPEASQTLGSDNAAHGHVLDPTSTREAGAGAYDVSASLGGRLDTRPRALSGPSRALCPSCALDPRPLTQLTFDCDTCGVSGRCYPGLREARARPLNVPGRHASSATH
jgi:hypothetical protein